MGDQKRRKLSTDGPSAAPAPSADPRFAFSAEDLADDNDDSTVPSKPIETSDSADAAGPSTVKTTLPAHLLPSSLTSKNARTPGLIYLSRIPPGMGPSKVKHLLSAYGEVGRVYLARADGVKEPTRSKSGKVRTKHMEHNFKEGWVEFMDKKVARATAEMLNAGMIGGKKGTRWRDDVWTMKYLPRFRWDMLSEQVALERATQTSLLRHHLSASRTEQESYLAAVEKARVGKAIETKRATQAAEGETQGKKRKNDAGGGDEPKKAKKERSYRQREAVDVLKKEDTGRGGTKKDLEGVLGKLF
ncbi:hypothetical protein MNV49_006654 [Pseudohyphozyma bogoriensis]|nr:hypothetical protein MNV49_006654 [Pseudohyphozyma bogoriensis]